jgi:hypothetical protein
MLRRDNHPAATPAEEIDLPVPLASERRVDARHPVAGAEARLLCEGMHYALRLKDVSSYGLCALTDAPVAPGQSATVLFEAEEPCEVEIRWVRRTLIGAAFLRPLAPNILHKMRQRHATLRRRARARGTSGRY